MLELGGLGAVLIASHGAGSFEIASTANSTKSTLEELPDSLPASPAGISNIRKRGT